MTTEPRQQTSTVTLLDGAPVVLRRLKKADIDAVIALHSQLSDRERYFRFFIVHPGHIKQFATDLVQRSADRYAIGAFENDQLIGAANYVRTNNPVAAEMAVAVAHGDHLRGVATVLLHHLAEVARRHGIRIFTADVLAENGPMLDVMHDFGAQTVASDGPVLHLEIDLSPIDTDTPRHGARVITSCTAYREGLT
ncbi:MAG TPA: GNAT family N-acetyltransferase [Mycobacterium sp.]|nr:GNAT family N-acetyltransferase [Mycobacterium sp.]